MKRAEWRRGLGELVRDAMRAPELDRYFQVKITRPGAQIFITCLFDTVGIVGRTFPATARRCR